LKLQEKRADYSVDHRGRTASCFISFIFPNMTYNVFGGTLNSTAVPSWVKLIEK